MASEHITYVKQAMDIASRIHNIEDKMNIDAGSEDICEFAITATLMGEEFTEDEILIYKLYYNKLTLEDINSDTFNSNSRLDEILNNELTSYFLIYFFHQQNIAGVNVCHDDRYINAVLYQKIDSISNTFFLKLYKKYRKEIVRISSITRTCIFLKRILDKARKIMHMNENAIRPYIMCITRDIDDYNKNRMFIN